MPAKHWPLAWVRSYSLRGRIWAATRRIVPCASGDSAPTSKAARCSDRTIQVTTFPASISSTIGAKLRLFLCPLDFRKLAALDDLDEVVEESHLALGEIVKGNYATGLV